MPVVGCLAATLPRNPILNRNDRGEKRGRGAFITQVTPARAAEALSSAEASRQEAEHEEQREKQDD